MRKLTGILFLLLAFAASLAATQTTSHYETKTGFLIPSQCQPRPGMTKPKGSYDDWPAPHTTECALREACIKSGYGLWAEDKFFRFDEKGQKIALEYFKTTKRTSYNKVEVLGEFRDGQVGLEMMRPVD